MIAEDCWPGSQGLAGWQRSGVEDKGRDTLVRRMLHLVLVGTCMLGTVAAADPVWVVDPAARL